MCKSLVLSQPANEFSVEVQEFADLRKRNLLILYYPVKSSISLMDLDAVRQVCRDAGLTRENPVAELDVIVHTYGGDPTAAYRIAQIIRDYASKVNFIIPEYAYSAGTLLCMAGDMIELGEGAGISPIDLALVSGGEPDSGRLEVQLIGIDNFKQFAIEARTETEQALKSLGTGAHSTVESDLLCTLVTEIGPLKLAKYYRERYLTGHYALELLSRYMFQAETAGRTTTAIQGIIANLLLQAPAHEYFVDFHLASGLGLRVRELSTDESDRAKKLIRILEVMKDTGEICLELQDETRLPFTNMVVAQSITNAEGETEGTDGVEASQGETPDIDETTREDDSGTGEAQEGLPPSAEGTGVVERKNGSPVGGGSK